MSPGELIRRSLLHVLPPRFHKIRHLGLYAAANVKTRLEAARALLPAPTDRPPVAPKDADAATLAEPSGEADPLSLFLDALRVCPACGARALRRTPICAVSRTPPTPVAPDTS